MVMSNNKHFYRFEIASIVVSILIMLSLIHEKYVFQQGLKNIVLMEFENEIHLASTVGSTFIYYPFKQKLDSTQMLFIKEHLNDMDIIVLQDNECAHYNAQLNASDCSREELELEEQPNNRLKKTLVSNDRTVIVTFSLERIVHSIGLVDSVSVEGNNIVFSQDATISVDLSIGSIYGKNIYLRSSLRGCLSMVLMAAGLVLALIYRKKHFDKGILSISDRIDELSKDSSTDALTGVMNRRALDRFSQQCGKFDYAIYMVDGNNIKFVNDNHGHEAGDECISNIARCISKTMRNTDLIFRYGGDEFVVIVKGVSHHEKATMILNKLRLNLSKVQCGSTHVSASVGYALSLDHKSFEQVIKSADQNMYEQKQMDKQAHSSIKMTG